MQAFGYNNIQSIIDQLRIIQMEALVKREVAQIQLTLSQVPLITHHRERIIRIL